MIKKELHYEDFDGNPVVTTAYFHLSKSELIEMELSEKGGMAQYYQTLLESDDRAKLVRAFKEIISASYGERDPSNPQSFRKSQEISDGFMASPAFDALFSELMTDEKATTEFVNGLIPKDLLAQAQKNQGRSVENVEPRGVRSVLDRDKTIELSGLKDPFATGDELLPWAFRDPTIKEQTAMTKAQLLDCMRRRTNGWEAPVGVPR